ncbi:uncharacterized protein LOC123702198 [Colias croceus]|uniref:uncharacterized protein LOC123702198 n=1 Tax=Colias crocea TaxID=72248 RepID=UPI001E2819A2|nr:uncharacterized protein LOC123702198 [Colias croceus]
MCQRVGLCVVPASDDSVFCSLTPATFYGLELMAAVKKCCVPNCGAVDEILHKFPNPDKELERFRDWIYNVGGDILGKENLYIYNYRRVCHVHFEEKYHTRSKKLSPSAIPTLRLSAFSFVRKHPLQEINQQIPINPDMPSVSGIGVTEKQPGLNPMRPSITLDVDIPPRAPAEPAKPSVPKTTKKKYVDGEQMLQQTIKKLQKRNDSYKERLRKAKKLSTNTMFQNALKK